MKERYFLKDKEVLTENVDKFKMYYEKKRKIVELLAIYLIFDTFGIFNYQIFALEMELTKFSSIWCFF